MNKLILFGFCFTSVFCFPDGGPVDSCVKDRANQPNHGPHRSQSLTTVPYKLVASSYAYKPNDHVTVSIEGSTPFKGFFIQARELGSDKWIGTWDKSASTNVHPECSSVTHGDPKDKVRATLVWRAPNNRGKVYFTGTVLKNYSTFWANVTSLA